MRVCKIPRARCERYVADGLSIREIAAREGWSVKTIQTHLRGLGISRSRVIVKVSDVLSVIEGRETVRQVAERLGVSKPAVSQCAHRKGFSLARRKPQLDLFEKAA